MRKQKGYGRLGSVVCGGAVMNNMEIEYVFIARKIWGSEWDEDDPYKSPEDALKKHGGITSVKDDDGDIIYHTADNAELYISYARYLKHALVRDGDIEPVVRAGGRIDFSRDLEDAEIERARVNEYLTKLRAKIAAGEITV
jgi:hypothetical protein